MFPPAEVATVRPPAVQWKRPRSGPARGRTTRQDGIRLTAKIVSSGDVGRGTLTYYITHIITVGSRVSPSNLIWAYARDGVKTHLGHYSYNNVAGCPAPHHSLPYTIVDPALTSSVLVNTPSVSMCVMVYRVDIMYELVGGAAVEVRAVADWVSLALRGRLKVGSRRLRIRREVSVVDSLEYRTVRRYPVQA